MYIQKVELGHYVMAKWNDQRSLKHMYNTDCLFWQPEIWYILGVRGKEVTGGRFCALVLGGQCADWEDVNSWQIEIPGNKPEVIKPVLPSVSWKLFAWIWSCVRK